MGADMNIPLGASVGAVRVPTEGKEFDKLFRYADKALYIVKRITAKWKENAIFEKYEVTTEIESVG